jgi:hypothetical protein
MPEKADLPFQAFLVLRLRRQKEGAVPTVLRTVCGYFSVICATVIARCVFFCYIKLYIKRSLIKGLEIFRHF